MDRPDLLTPESLAMDRGRIRLTDRMIRVFNGRGAVSLRDHTVTGLQGLQFTPFENRDWMFHLAFRDTVTGTVIDDIAADAWDYHARTGRGSHPLGLNFGAGVGGTGFDPSDGSPPRVLILQDCIWQPNQVTRTGTFHKLIDGTWISFAIETVARASGDDDAVLMQVTLHNRSDTALDLTMLARQRIADPLVVDPSASDLAEHPDPYRIVAPVVQLPGGTHRMHARFQSTVVSDQPTADGGWHLSIPPGESTVVSLAVEFSSADKPAPAHTQPHLDERFAAAEVITRQRLAQASDSLPRVQSTLAGLDEFYNRAILSLLETRWTRDDWVHSPFYVAGTWLFTLAWDVCFASAAIALLDPSGLRKAISAYLDAGLLKHSYIGWDGSLGHHYVYTVFSGVWVLRDYLEVTGDLSYLDEAHASGGSIFSEVVAVIDELRDTYTTENGLIDFGGDTHDYLETRTDGYQHRVAIANLMLVDALRWIADVAALRGEDSERWTSAADALKRTTDEQLWDAQTGWFANLFPDDSRHEVWSYQLFDSVRGAALTAEQRGALAAHVREGVFLGPHGMYSIAKTDTVHWDRDDADWGGGGQYVGMPLRTAESLWRANEPEKAWDILARCVTWIDAFPYFPQEVFTDRLGTPDVEQAVEVSAGGGIQAVVFGLFGIRPQLDGTLLIEPARQPAFYGAVLTGYRHANRSVDVRLADEGFIVTVDGFEEALVEYGSSSTSAARQLGDEEPLR